MCIRDSYVIEPQEISEMVKPDKTVKILIVEDNPEMRKVLAQIFEQIYDCLLYTSADMCQCFFQIHDGHIHLFLCIVKASLYVYHIF